MSDRKPMTPETAVQKIAPIVEQANALTITSAADYERAANGLKLIKGNAKRIDTELIEPWRQQKRHADQEMKRLKTILLDPLTEAESILKQKQVDWYQEQERIRMAAELEARRKAEEEADRERQRLIKEAAKRKTEEARDRLLDKAEAVEVKPVEIPVAAPPKLEGQHFVTRWTAKVTDARAAVLAIMEWPDWFNYVQLNGGELNRWAARTKGMAKVDGIEVASEKTLSSRSA